MAEEEQKHQASMEEFSAVLESCPSEDHWALMYPLQLLAGGVTLAPLLEKPAATQPQAVADMGSVFAPLTLDTPVPKPGIKQWHLSSSQGMPNLRQEEEALCDLPMETPHKKWKSLARTLREA